jgi:hypothetical protein
MTAEDGTQDRILGVFDTAAISWVVLREAVVTMPTLFASGIIAYALIYVGASRLGVVITAPRVGGPASFVGIPVYVAFRALTDFCESVVLASIAIPMHRLVLRNERSDHGVEIFSRRTLHFAFWLTVFQLAWLALTLIEVVAAKAAPILVTIAVTASLSLIVVLFVVEVRLGFLFPALALDLPSPSHKGRLADAWKLSQGRFWRLLGSTLLAALPLALGSAILGFVVLALTAGHSFQDTSESIHWWQIVSSALLKPIGAALGASVLSFNYSFALPRTAAGAP